VVGGQLGSAPIAKALPARKPAIPLNIVADYAGASMHGALGIMFALFARERTGRGQHVDVSYLDTSVALLAATPNMRFFWSDGMAPKRGREEHRPVRRVAVEEVAVVEIAVARRGLRDRLGRQISPCGPAT